MWTPENLGSFASMAMWHKNNLSLIRLAYFLQLPLLVIHSAGISSCCWSPLQFCFTVTDPYIALSLSICRHTKPSKHFPASPGFLQKSQWKFFYSIVLQSHHHMDKAKVYHQDKLYMCPLESHM